MSLTIDIPPAIVQEATEYAQAKGVSLGCLLKNYLVELTQQRGRARLLGAAARYAKPSLRNRERAAFRRAMEAKHAAIR